MTFGQKIVVLARDLKWLLLLVVVVVVDGHVSLLLLSKEDKDWTKTGRRQGEDAL